MGVKHFTTSMSRINNYILFFLNATVLSKYSKEEHLGICCAAALEESL
jgi:hypothetical protein